MASCRRVLEKFEKVAEVDIGMLKAGSLPIDYPDERAVPKNVARCEVVVTECAPSISGESGISRPDKGAERRRPGGETLSARLFVPGPLVVDRIEGSETYCRNRVQPPQTQAAEDQGANIWLRKRLSDGSAIDLCGYHCSGRRIDANDLGGDTVLRGETLGRNGLSEVTFVSWLQADNELACIRGHRVNASGREACLDRRDCRC